MKVEWRPDLLGGVAVVKGRALALEASGWEKRLYARLGEVEERAREVEFTAIPYYAWANREPGPMQVWVRLARTPVKAQ